MREREKEGMRDQGKSNVDIYNYQLNNT